MSWKRCSVCYELLIYCVRTPFVIIVLGQFICEPSIRILKVYFAKTCSVPEIPHGFDVNERCAFSLGSGRGIEPSLLQPRMQESKGPVSSLTLTTGHCSLYTHLVTVQYSEWEGMQY